MDNFDWSKSSQQSLLIGQMICILIGRRLRISYEHEDYRDYEYGSITGVLRVCLNLTAQMMMRKPRGCKKLAKNFIMVVMGQTF